MIPFEITFASIVYVDPNSDGTVYDSNGTLYDPID